MQCWLRGLDGLVFERDDLERLLGLGQFKSKRIELILDDFPYHEVLLAADKRDVKGDPNSFDCLWVSRKRFIEAAFNGEATTSFRFKHIYQTTNPESIGFGFGPSPPRNTFSTPLKRRSHFLPTPPISTNGSWRRICRCCAKDKSRRNRCPRYEKPIESAPTSRCRGSRAAPKKSRFNDPRSGLANPFARRRGSPVHGVSQCRADLSRPARTR